MLQKITFYLSAILLGLLPFHALFTTILKFGFNLNRYPILSLAITSWKEGLIILIGFITLLNILKSKRSVLSSQFSVLSSQLSVLNSQFFIFLFLLLSILSLTFALPPSGFTQFIWGLRYDFLFLITFLIFSCQILNKKNIQFLINISLYSACASILVGLIIFIIKPENLTFLGFRNDWSTWYANEALAFCQRIENSNFCRLSGTFAGPNQYGAYLIVILPILFWKFLQTQSKKWIIFIFMGLISLILTFSRSAWIALFAEITVFLSIKLYQNYQPHLNFKRIKYFILAGSIFLISLLIIFFNSTNLQNTIIRPNSSSGHIDALILGGNKIIEKPFGHGLGTAGPASYRFASEQNPAIITENWYLQIGVELGIIGMILFISILGFIIYENLQKYKQHNSEINLYLTLSLIGISTAALFLHSFEDSSTVLTLFTLLGLTSSNTQSEA